MNAIHDAHVKTHFAHKVYTFNRPLFAKREHNAQLRNDAQNGVISSFQHINPVLSRDFYVPPKYRALRADLCRKFSVIDPLHFSSHKRQQMADRCLSYRITKMGIKQIAGAI